MAKLPNHRQKPLKQPDPASWQASHDLTLGLSSSTGSSSRQYTNTALVLPRRYVKRAPSRPSSYGSAGSTDSLASFMRYIYPKPHSRNKFSTPTLVENPAGVVVTVTSVSPSTSSGSRRSVITDGATSKSNLVPGPIPAARVNSGGTGAPSSASLSASTSVHQDNPSFTDTLARWELEAATHHRVHDLRTRSPSNPSPPFVRDNPPLLRDFAGGHCRALEIQIGMLLPKGKLDAIYRSRPCMRRYLFVRTTRSTRCHGKREKCT